MDVGLVTNNYQTSFCSSQVKKNSKCFSLESGQQGFSDEISLYYDICKKYPNVSFRMDDYQNTGDITSDFSYHQTKDGFSSPGTPSITIDKNLLTKALKDSNFENELRGTIDTVVYNYKNLTRRDADDPIYCAVDLIDDNGDIRTDVTRANSQFSTDEQLKNMWHVTDTVDIEALMQLIDKIQIETRERLYELQSHYKMGCQYMSE